uniref:Sas10 domain-containing protein n=1 Tax=Onchocerca volvulus TaxID=6282 RepID=A0A8R1Y1X5_ONCVO
MDSEEDSDEIYDEIDRHHMSLDMPDNDKRDTEIHRPVEVLNVEADSSNDDDDDDDDDYDYDNEDNRNSFSDSEEDNLNNVEKFLPSADKWGSGRKSFYNTSYVDEDWGGMNEAEAELAELEEEDAIARQKKLDAALGLLPMQFQDEIPEEEIAPDLRELPDIESMTTEEQYEYFLKVNPDFKQIFNEYQTKRIYFITDVLPLLNVARSIKRFRPGLVLEKQLFLAVNVFSRYLTNLLFALYIKIAGSSHQKAPEFIDHPVLQAISILRKEMFAVMHFLEKHNVILRKIRNNIKSNDFGNILDTFPTTDFVQKLKISERNEENEQLLIEEDRSDNEVQIANDGREEGIVKRLITNQIEKNKGLQNKRKKGTQHSRVKKRKQFKKALIKKHSQRADARKELNPYGGETRGIRASTVKSVKLKA